MTNYNNDTITIITNRFIELSNNNTFPECLNEWVAWEYNLASSPGLDCICGNYTQRRYKFYNIYNKNSIIGLERDCLLLLIDATNSKELQQIYDDSIKLDLCESMDDIEIGMMHTFPTLFTGFNALK